MAGSPAPEPSFEFGFGSQASSFSLAEEVSRQAGKSVKIEQSSESTQNKKPRSSGSSAHCGKMCSYCSEPAVEHQDKCVGHKRALDCIRKQATRAEGSQEAEAFYAIFGKKKEGPPDAVLAGKVLDEFLEEYPDCKVKLMKQSTKAKPFKVGQFVHSQGFRKEHSDIDQKHKWDEELFVRQMANLRGWNNVRAKQEWGSLKSNPSTYRDEMGPAHSRERLGIPAELIGASFISDASTNYEDKKVEESSKAKALNTQEKEKLQAECARGFAMHADLEQFKAQSGMALAAGSITGDRADQQKSLSEILGIRAGVAAAGPTHQGQGGGAIEAESSPGKEPPAKKPRVVDLGRARNTSTAAATKAVKTVKTKIQAVLAEALVIHVEAQTKYSTNADCTSFMATLKERCDLAEAWLGVTTTFADGVPTFLVQEFTAVNSKDVLVDGTEEKAVLHDVLLKKTMEPIKLLPIESRDFMAASRMTFLLAALASAESVDDIERIDTDMTQNRLLCDQLAKGLKIASADMKKAMRDIDKDQKKQLDNASREQADKARVQTEEKEVHERRRIVQLKGAGCFNVKFAENGHNPLKVYDSPAAFVKALEETTDLVWSQPCIIRGAWIEGDLKVLPGTLKSWTKNFPKNTDTNGHNVAPLYTAHGLDEATATLRQCLPQKFEVQSGLPSFQGIVDKVMLYGSLCTALDFVLDATRLGSFRFHAYATQKLVIGNVMEMHKVLKSKTPEAMTVQSYSDALKTLTDNSAKELKSGGCVLHFGELQPGMCLMVPPGFVVGSACTATELVHPAGFKKAFLPAHGLPKTDSLMQFMLKECGPSEAQAAHLNMVMDVLVVAKQKGAA
jgi:hypothetical protein